jgi:predicted nucleic acid-binding protein
VSAFLIDTNVISELVKPAPDPRVLAFLARERDLWLSVLSLHELSYGAARLSDSDRRRRLNAWLDSIRLRFKGRWIGVDEDIAAQAGRARAEAAAMGRSVTPMDSMIAATASSRSLTLATRNLRDFEAVAVATFDPWSA